MPLTDMKPLQRALPSVKPTTVVKPLPPAHHRPPTAFSTHSILLRDRTHPGSLLISIPFRDKRVFKSAPPRKPVVSKAKLELLADVLTKNLSLAQLKPRPTFLFRARVERVENPATRELLEFRPTVKEAKALIERFGEVGVFTYAPHQPNAHINPWSQLPKGSYGAVSRSGNIDQALFRLKCTTNGANNRIKELVEDDLNQVLNAGVDEEDVLDWMVAELVGVYQGHFNRRKGLMKEVEILKARDMVSWMEGRELRCL